MVVLNKPSFHLENPGIVSIALGFVAAIIVAIAFPSSREEHLFNELVERFICPLTCRSHIRVRQSFVLWAALFGSSGRVSSDR